MTSIDELTVQCERAAVFPKNVSRCSIYEHRVNSYFERLNQQQERLFRSEKAESAIDFWEFDAGGNGMVVVSHFIFAF